MSYTGYVQQICKNGHYREIDSNFIVDKDENVCHHCREEISFQNHVDTTNGFDQGIIPKDKFILLGEEIKEKCNLGHLHITSPAIYKIPSEKEVKSLRVYFKEV